MSTTNSKEQHTKSLATLQLEYHRKQEARKKGTQTGSAAASSEASNTQAGTGVPLTAAPTLASLGVKTAPDERPVEVHEGDMEFWNKRLGQSSKQAVRPSLSTEPDLEEAQEMDETKRLVLK